MIIFITTSLIRKKVKGIAYKPTNEEQLNARLSN